MLMYGTATDHLQKVNDELWEIVKILRQSNKELEELAKLAEENSKRMEELVNIFRSHKIT